MKLYGKSMLQSVFLNWVLLFEVNLISHLHLVNALEDLDARTQGFDVTADLSLLMF